MYTRTHGGAGSSAHANYSNILTYISSGSRDLYTARGSHDQQQMTAQTSSKNTQSRNREHPVRELVGVVSRPQLANQIISMWAGLQSHKPRGWPTETMMSQSSTSTSSGASDGGSSSPESSPDCVRARIGVNAGTKDVFSLQNLYLLPPNDQVKELQTIIWDKWGDHVMLYILILFLPLERLREVTLYSMLTD